MTITILVIALAHAVPVVFFNLTQGPGSGFICAIVMSLIAVFSGGMQYAVFDLIAIWLAFAFIRHNSQT
jgi:hypothetical protein